MTQAAMRMGQARTKRHWLLLAALTPPVIWAARLVIAYPLVPVACQAGTVAGLLALSGVALSLSLGAGVISWFLWRREPPAPEGLEGTAGQRARFIALSGMIASGIFSLLIFSESLPIVTRDPCAGVDLSPRITRPVKATGLLLLGFYPNAAQAHVVDPVPTPEEAFATWSPDPFILLSLAVGVSAYVQGARRVWRRRPRGGALRAKTLIFAAGLLVLVVALLSPVDTVGGLLFSAHMVQHLLLTAVAAPLIAFARPGRITFFALPVGVRRRLGAVWSRASVRAIARALRHPLCVGALFALALWAWHLPSLYEAALQSEVLHGLEHLSFFGTALLFWSFVRDSGAEGSSRTGQAILLTFFTMMHSGVLGVLIALAPLPWYEPHAAGTAGWALSPLEDQQLAGLLMWVPGGLVHLGAALWLFAAWLKSSEVRARRREAPRTQLIPPWPVDGGSKLLPLVVLATTILFACERDAERPQMRAAAGVMTGVGEAGAARFEVTLVPRTPRTGELFEARTSVVDARTGAPIQGARFSLDATMPHHGHGMTTRPEHEAEGGGEFRTRGMKLHMPGRWTFTARAEWEGGSDEASFIFEQPHHAAGR